jgi:EAL domain-containing protein (putative c-di-GMP-specific phosphodiesterase class I)
MFLWFPVHHSMGKVLQHLRKSGFEYQVMAERHGCSLTCQSGQVQQVVQQIAPLLTAQELRTTQVLFIQGNEQPQLHDFSDIMSLSQFISFSQSDWLVDILTEQRLTSHFQPIVEMQDTSRIYGYEALVRGKDLQGNLVMPGSLFESATNAGLIPQLDRAARLSAIAAAHQHNVHARLFINFMPTAVYDPVACLRSTVDAIDAAGIRHDRIVFEVVESSHPQELEHLKSVLRFYREAGFSVALDDLGSGFSSLNLLHQLRPDLLKLDLELVRNVHLDSYKASITEKILEIAQKLNIETVAEGIESPEELDWLRERGATYAQGYLIGKPAVSPAQTTPHFVRRSTDSLQAPPLCQQLQQSNPDCTNYSPSMA